MNTEISNRGIVQVRFLPEVWEAIKEYVGITADFPVEILQVLKFGLPLEEIAQIVYTAVDARRFRISMRDHAECLSDEAVLRFAEQAKWLKRGKTGSKQRLLRMFWNSPNKCELFHYVAWELIQKRMVKDMFIRLIESMPNEDPTSVSDSSVLEGQIQLSATLWNELLQARDAYFSAHVFY